MSFILPAGSAIAQTAAPLEPDTGAAPPPSDEDTVGTTDTGATVEPAPGAAGGVEAGSAPDEAAEGDTGVVAEQGTGLFEQGVAGDADAEAVESPAETTAGFDLDGYVRSDAFVGKDPDSRRALLQAGYGELSLQVRGHKQRLGSAYADARLRYGQVLDTRDLVIDLREAYVDLNAGPVDLRLGQQIIVWGRADAFNPTNNLSPFDLRVRSPIEDDRRVGKLGARAFYNLAPVRIEGVWLPLYTPAEYPPVKLQDYVVMVDPVFPSNALEDGLGAGRVHLELPAFEGSVSYLFGPALLPGLDLRSYSIGTPLNADGTVNPLGADPPEVRIARHAYNQHVVGFDFSTAISDVIAIRGEAAYRHPVDYENRVYAARPDVQYVLGADKAFGPVSVIVQYMGRYVFNWKKENGPTDPITPNALLTLMPPLPPFVRENIEGRLDDELAQHNQVLFAQTAQVQHLATMRVEWLTMHDTLSLSALGMLNLTTQEWLVFPKLEYRISDALRAYLGAEIYYGPNGTLFDLIDQTLTAGYTELRYSF